MCNKLIYRWQLNFILVLQLLFNNINICNTSALARRFARSDWIIPHWGIGAIWHQNSSSRPSVPKNCCLESLLLFQVFGDPSQRASLEGLQTRLHDNSRPRCFMVYPTHALRIPVCPYVPYTPVLQSKGRWHGRSPLDIWCIWCIYVM